MHGHADGRMDYVWVLSSGRMTVWPNLGKKSVVGDEVFWSSPKDLFHPGRDIDRRDLHLVDWNNDGACDIVFTGTCSILVDPEDHSCWTCTILTRPLIDPNNNNNRVSVWINNYKTTGTFTWTYVANPAPALNCPEKRGLGIHDLAVRFGDISGNGLGGKNFLDSLSSSFCKRLTQILDEASIS